MSASFSPSSNLPAAAVIVSGRVLQRFTSGGEEKVKHATDPLIANESHVGFAVHDVTDITTVRGASFACPGQMASARGAAAGLLVTDYELVSNAVGQLVAKSAVGQQVVALNVEGEALAVAAGSADKPIRVLAVFYISS